MSPLEWCLPHVCKAGGGGEKIHVFAFSNGLGRHTADYEAVSQHEVPGASDVL